MGRKDFLTGVKVHTKRNPLCNLILAHQVVDKGVIKWVCILASVHMNKNRYGIMVFPEDELDIGWREDWEGPDYTTSVSSVNSNPDPDIEFYQWLQNYKSMDKKRFLEFSEYKQLNYRREFEEFKFYQDKNQHNT